MRIVKSKRYRCIRGNDAEDFEAAVNAVLEEHPYAEVKIDTLIPFMAHAWINCNREVPETKAEEHELAGDVHYCIECPFLERPQNSKKQQKRFPCRYATYGITMTDCQCCDKYYETIERKGVNE